MVKAGIIGATGYAGVELVRILLKHPGAEIAAVGSQSFEGQPVSAVYPSLEGICDMPCVSAEEVIAKSDVVFACVPAGVSQEYAAVCDKEGKAFIDLGADFRLYDEDTYTKWYKGSFHDKLLHEKATYAQPELFREAIRKTRILGNPGCYPTSVALGLAPAIERGLIETGHIIIDSKSGATGAGRGLGQNTHFPDCNEGFSPYKVAMHRHTPEIEQTLSILAGNEVKVTFVPHLLPLNRGIISTMYAPLKEGVSMKDVRGAYTARYREEPFVRVLAEGQTANLSHVRCSNLCEISLHEDAHTKTLIVVSAIDNMVKGAAGQAVQNMNLIFGLPETQGLDLVPTAF